MAKLEDLKNIVDTNLDKLDLSKDSKLRLINSARNAEKGNFRGLRLLGFPAVAAVIALVLIFGNIFPKQEPVKVLAEKIYADNLMKEILPRQVQNVELKDQFVKAAANFSVELFKKSYKKGVNSLISPTSAYLALGMTANGADGKTLKEFETVLGKGIEIEDLNKYYNSLSQKLTQNPYNKVNIANSIWYRKEIDLGISKDFLQVNADYYKAAANKVDFNDPKTKQDINNWVKENTENKIDKIIDEIGPLSVMYLINVVNFEAGWEVTYKEAYMRPGEFTLINSKKKPVNFMTSSEYGHLRDSKAQGFIKPYIGGKYSFVALLPDKGVSLDKYISSLSGEKFIKLINNQVKEEVTVAIPTFKSEYSVELVDPLKKMGLKECFDGEKADFSKMGGGSNTNLFVSNVLQKTYINVDLEGTKASAVTKVEMRIGASQQPKTQTLTFDRPFVYAIIDNETKLPLFIGAMVDPES